MLEHFASLDTTGVKGRDGVVLRCSNIFPIIVISGPRFWWLSSSIFCIRNTAVSDFIVAEWLRPWGNELWYQWISLKHPRKLSTSGCLPSTVFCYFVEDKNGKKVVLDWREYPLWSNQGSEGKSKSPFLVLHKNRNTIKLAFVLSKLSFRFLLGLGKLSPQQELYENHFGGDWDWP